MKPAVKIFSFLFVVTLLAACASGESEMLKQARTIQDGMMTEVHALDSTVENKIDVLNAELSTMSADSTMMTDSTKLQAYVTVKKKYDNLMSLQSEMTDWKDNIKMLPTVEEMNNGAENPFGEEAKDQEVLAHIKKSKEDWTAMKARVEAATR